MMDLTSELVSEKGEEPISLFTLHSSLFFSVRRGAALRGVGFDQRGVALRGTAGVRDLYPIGRVYQRFDGHVRVVRPNRRRRIVDGALIPLVRQGRAAGD